ncbi:hypothetical protein BTVI_127884 [Pitangus sulphuratus]|nr:hypothetical protein BTVI_127884 [Pitangus sulphuratus]
MSCLSLLFSRINNTSSPSSSSKEELQPLHELCCPSLDMLQHLNVFLEDDPGQTYKSESKTWENLDQTEKKAAVAALKRAASTLHRTSLEVTNTSDKWKTTCVQDWIYRYHNGHVCKNLQYVLSSQDVEAEEPSSLVHTPNKLNKLADWPRSYNEALCKYEILSETLEISLVS